MPVKNKMKEFIQNEAFAGLLIIFSAFVAIILANSAFGDFYKSAINYKIKFGSEDSLGSIKTFIKDVLMVLFFFVVGLELKKEMVVGVLKDRAQVILPLVAALAGMVVPALIYYFFNYNDKSVLHGWAVPCATDIAFAIAILTIFGKNISLAARIFLLAIAIFDDLGAIIVIALFYNDEFNFVPLLLAFAGGFWFWFLTKKNFFNYYLTVFFGIFLWFTIHYSGIHTTIAGVILALLVPISHGSKKPVEDLIQKLHTPVSYFILPLFAFTSAGIVIKFNEFSDIFNNLTMGVAAGLFFGKQIGIFGVCLVAYLINKNLKPQATWRELYAVSVLAGIGFTMSIFVTYLGFKTVELQDLSKLGVIVGSLASTIFGALVLWLGKAKVKENRG